MARIHKMNGKCRYSEILFGAIVGRMGYPDKILELGCGIGRNLSMFKHSALRVGIDPYVKNLNYGKENYAGIDFRKGNHENIGDIVEEHFDIAFTCSVLDHIEKPAKAIKALTKIADYVLLFEPEIVGENRKAKKGETGRYKNTWYHNYNKLLEKYHYFRIDFPLYNYWSGMKFKMIIVWKNR